MGLIHKNVSFDHIGTTFSSFKPQMLPEQSKAFSPRGLSSMLGYGYFGVWHTWPYHILHMLFGDYNFQ